MADFVGKKIGKYQIEEKIGRGAMAEVYRAYHPTLDRHVAIKVLHSFLSEKTDNLDRFQREAQNVAALNHRNIVQVHDFDTINDMNYMVMEFIDGRSLKQLLKDLRDQGELVPLQKAIGIVDDIASALAYAHEQGVVHRDVKPANVMIDKTERIVLTDFGLARIVSGPQFTTTGAIVGTPAYMPPEQGLGQAGDARSDIYSLGAMLYQLVTGKFPFNGESPLAIVFKHINAPLPAPRSINPDIPGPLETIILKTMEKDPNQRFQKAKDLQIALNELAVGYPKVSDSQPVATYFAESTENLVLSFHIIETGQIITVENKNEITVGRLDGAIRPDIDLNPFDALKKGVSRLHSEIRVSDENEITLYDLGSTNGTWLNGKKLDPDEPETVHHGDMIAFGKVMMQILVRQS